jgi:hypothetical protein
MKSKKPKLNAATSVILVLLLFIITNTFIPKRAIAWVDTDRGSDGSVSEDITTETTVGEKVYIDRNMRLEKIGFRTVTWGNEYKNSDVLQIRVINTRDNKVAVETEVPMSELKDNEIYEVEIDDVRLKYNDWYLVEFSAKDGFSGTKLGIMTYDVNGDKHHYVIDGKEDNSKDLSLQLWGV